MRNKKGFISMTLVYSFFIMFLFLMLAIISAYTEKNKFLDAIDDKISEDIGISKNTKDVLLNKLLLDNEVLSSSNIDLNKIANSSEENGNGFFYIESTAEDNLTDENNDNNNSRIYYFRGSVENNYLVYGKEFVREENGYISKNSIKQMCWKIIRTNEDGTIRLAYSGTFDEENEKCQTNTLKFNSKKFNNSDNDNAYVGYTYGGSNQTTYDATHYLLNNSFTSSNAKSILDDWYLKNTNLAYNSDYKYATGPDTDPNILIVSTLQDNIGDSIFCNNRMIVSGTGIATDITSYKNSSIIASFKCDQDIDRYSLSLYSNGSNTKLNSLTYSVGLLTSNDIIFAGGSTSKENSSFYLNYGKNYWTMTPYDFDGTANLLYVNNKGKLDKASVSSEFGLIPVISIKPSIIVQTGSGLSNDPYILGW